jgi:hypothetical protein
MTIVSWRSGIMPIRSYDEAKAHYESVEPIRGSGRNAGVRPLGYRRKPQFQIVAGEARIHCKLYRHHVVTFHDHGAITFDASYKSDTTAKFIGDVLNVMCSVRDNKLVLWLGENVYNVAGLELRNENGYLVPTRCVGDVVHVIDRKAMSEVRKDVKDFKKFLSGYLKILEGKVEKKIVEEVLVPLAESSPVNAIVVTTLALDTWRLDGERHLQTLNKFMGMVRGGQENWHQASLWLVHSHSDHYWNGVLSFTDAKVMRGFDEILIALNPHVLMRELVPAGQVKVDRYKKFKTFMEAEDV